MSARGWRSALSPQRPPIPTNSHWAVGLTLAAGLLAASIYVVAERNMPDVIEDDGGEEAMIVALGAPAQRLEPPPVETPPEPQPEPQTPTERAEDAPPPEPPPQPRPVAPPAPSDGRLSSGFGTGQGPPAPPPPPPVRRTTLDQGFIDISTREYVRRVEYPYEALRRGIQGRGRLRVRIDRSGRVVEWRLAQSAGHRLLDREIERVAKQVEQLDPLPDDFGRRTADLIIPFAFVIEAAPT
ncbi:MAG: energy transducer TonB [Pseudomonadota bacterium]